MQLRRLKKIIEATYRISAPRSSWLEGLSKSAEAVLGQGLGSVTALIDATDVRHMKVVDYATTRKINGLDRIVEETVASVDPSYVEDTKRAGASLATEDGGMEQEGLRIWAGAFGAKDVLTVLAMDASGMGAIIATSLGKRRLSNVRQNTSLSHVAAHILSSYHLREDPHDDVNDAVFRPDGGVVSASDRVKESEAVANLAKAVRALTELRGGAAKDGDALGRFTSRVDATWSVVSEVDDGTDQWIVARRNRPAVAPLPKALSQREQEVVTLLLLGRTQKLVAYELGIAHSTVRVLISRALAKLGAKTIEDARLQFIRT